MEQAEIEHLPYWDDPKKGTEMWVARHKDLEAFCESEDEAKKMLKILKRLVREST